MKTNQQLRAAARAQLGGNIFSDKWLSALVLMLVYGVIASFLSSFLVTVIFLGPVLVGVSFVFLASARGKEKITLQDLAKGFQDGFFGRAVLLYVLQFLYIFLWSLLLVIPGIIKTYSYRLAYYISIDHPEYTASQCIAESCRLMKGYKWQAFLLDLSFIGWYIVGSLVCGIGTVFVTPYNEAAFASFYVARLEAEEGVYEASVTEEQNPQ